MLKTLVRSTVAWNCFSAEAMIRSSAVSVVNFIPWGGQFSKIFVPYRTGSSCYYDVGFNFGLTRVGNADCPPNLGGTVLAGNVCKEVRDRGLSWKSDSAVYRGQEVSLWAALAAANYNYVMEWTFRDGGVILGRVGGPSPNFSAFPIEPNVPH